MTNALYLSQPVNQWASQAAQMVKSLSAMWETGVQFLSQDDPWRRAWQPIAVFLPGVFHGQSSLAGYSPWGHKESDATEQLISCLSLCWGKTHVITVEAFTLISPNATPNTLIGSKQIYILFITPKSSIQSETSSVA